MALRGVKPFNAEQWAQLEALMKRGPSEKQLKRNEEAKENMKNRKICF